MGTSQHHLRMPSQSQRAIFRRQVAAEACQIPEISADYNLPLHVGALFIILAVSFTACVLPIIVVKVPKLRIPPTTLFVVRHFGTGVLIATAFVHLLPTAFISLTDPCLPAFWHETYPAMGGALALAAVFGIIIIQMVFSPGKNCCIGMEAECIPAVVDGSCVWLHDSDRASNRTCDTYSVQSRVRNWALDCGNFQCHLSWTSHVRVNR